ncbi:hypothetical protein ACFVWG_02800 [Kribbella sp. NPDC058245]|uniref:hypothetical protein n=1 Tax=Kribbella sp. NPDC058245 TaxID=3346399 RepID=UPI0036E37385
MTAAPRVDVLVPFGEAPAHPERTQNLIRVLTDLCATLDYPNYRVSLVEISARPSQQRLADELGAGYVFARRDGEFSPGRAMNLGVVERSRPAELIYFHQTDFLVGPDVLSRAVDQLQRLDCPFVFPYWGEIHLSAPVSTAIRRAELDPVDLLARFRRLVGSWRTETPPAQGPQATGHDEVVLTSGEYEYVTRSFPSTLKKTLHEAAQVDLWGVDDRPYAPYRWTPSTDRGAEVCRISRGPRASAAYLCTDQAFRRAGGVPELPGWGFEDLMFWQLIQAFHPYAADRAAISYDGTAVTLGDPLLHLWHPVSGSSGYYAATAENQKAFNHLAALDATQIRQQATPLPDAPPQPRHEGSAP